MAGYDTLAEVYEWLISDAKLRQVGLVPDMSTFNPEAENYMVVAGKV